MLLRNTNRMKENNAYEKAERIRDVIRYIKRFKGALIVIYLDDNLIESPNFLGHIKDICLVHETGLKTILVPGANKRINEILSKAGISWTMHQNCRITGTDAMPLIKMAAFDVSNQIMTALAGEGKTAVIGNWVRAKGKGVIAGIDYGTSGEIDKLQVESIETVLEDGLIPIFPCIGWSVAGKPYNISSVELAEQIAVHLKADKLFFLAPNAEITTEFFTIPKEITFSPNGTLPALSLDELDLFLKANEHLGKIDKENKDSSQHLLENNTESDGKILQKEKIFFFLKKAEEACHEGVSRTHILNGSLPGAIPLEIFSDFGSGTMIYSENYGKIRAMTREDIPSVLNVMQPFIEADILLPRTKETLLIQCQNFIVYELDGAIRACASLVPYPDGQMEIAAVAVERTFANTGIGEKMIVSLIKQAQEKNASGVFLLTTQTVDWFEKLGFELADTSTLPKERKEKMKPERGSKVLRLKKN